MTSMATSSTWHYRFEKHKVAYGSVLLIIGLVVATLAGHDGTIMRDILTGQADWQAANALYLHITNYTVLAALGIIGLAVVVSSIVYMILVALAHRRIAKDRFPL